LFPKIYSWMICGLFILIAGFTIINIDLKAFYSDTKDEFSPDGIHLVKDIPISNSLWQKILTMPASELKLRSSKIAFANAWRDGQDPMFSPQATRVLGDRLELLKNSDQGLRERVFVFFITFTKEDVKKFKDPALFYSSVKPSHEVYLNGKWLAAGDRNSTPTVINLPKDLVEGENIIIWKVTNSSPTALRGLSNRFGLAIRSAFSAHASKNNLIFQETYVHVIAITVLFIFAFFGFQSGLGQNYPDINAYVLFNLSLALMVANQLMPVYLGLASLDSSGVLGGSSLVCSTALVIITSSYFSKAFYRIRGKALVGTNLLVTILVGAIVYLTWFDRAEGTQLWTAIMTLNSRLLYLLLASQFIAIITGGYGFYKMAQSKLRDEPHQMPVLRRRAYDYLGFSVAIFLMLGIYSRTITVMWVNQGFDYSFLAGLLPAFYMHNLFIKNLHRSKEFEERMSLQKTEADDIVYWQGGQALTEVYQTYLWGGDLAGFKKISDIKGIQDSQIDRKALADDLQDFLRIVKEDLLALGLPRGRKPFINKRMGDYWWQLIRANNNDDAHKMLLAGIENYIANHGKFISAWRSSLVKILEKHLPDDFSYHNASQRQVFTKEALIAFASKIDVHPQIDILTDVILDVEGDVKRPDSPVDFISDQFSALSQPSKDSTHHRIAISKRAAQVIFEADICKASYRPNERDHDYGYLVIDDFEHHDADVCTDNIKLGPAA